MKSKSERLLTKKGKFLPHLANFEKFLDKFLFFKSLCFQIFTNYASSTIFKAKRKDYATQKGKRCGNFSS